MTQRLVGAFIVAALLSFLLLWPPNVAAQETHQSPITVAWDGVSGAGAYRLYLDGGSPTEWFTTTTDPIVVPPGAHSLTISAVVGLTESARSAPLDFLIAQLVDPACVAPLGNRAVSIFVTQLQKTGSGGALSKARLDFQLASPNSPITHVAIRTMGGDLMTMDGASLGALAGMWFTVPATPGTYPLSVLATNLYGCTTEVLTSKSVMVQ